VDPVTAIFLCGLSRFSPAQPCAAAMETPPGSAFTSLAASTISQSPFDISKDTEIVSIALKPWADCVHEAAARFAIPVRWIEAVMNAESRGQTLLDGRPITSPAGAMGLMQLMPSTYAEMRQRYGLGPDPYDPHDNIMAGAAYLRELFDRYGAPHFLAAYNAGPTRLDRFLSEGKALPAETQAYLAVLDPLIAKPAPRSSAAPRKRLFFDLRSMRTPASDQTSSAVSNVLFVPLSGAATARP